MSGSVVLLNPNRMKPPVAPLALECLAASLEGFCDEVRILDLCLADDPQQALGEALSNAEVDLVGITLRNLDDAYMATRVSAIPELSQVVGWVKEHCHAPIVLGGSGFSIAPAGILRRTDVGIGVVGDGEQALPRLAFLAQHGKLDAESCLRVPGTAVATDGQVLLTPPKWAPLARKPLSRSWLDNARYFAEGGQAGVETRRGCYHKCIYCVDRQSKGRETRLRPPWIVGREIEYLLEQGVDHLHICDTEFNVPMYHAVAVAKELIRRGLGEKLRWYAYCTPRPFSAELAQLLARSGCAGLNFGADSGDERMLQQLGRDHGAEHIREAAATCREHGIACMFDLLLGGPGETVQSVRNTLELMKEIEPDCVGVAVGMRVYPGTELARLVGKEGYSAANPNLHGQVEHNEDMVMPVFYLTSELGEEIFTLVDELIGGDRRFFFGGPHGEQPDYSYSENEPLVEAIRAGARGAYWDILRKVDN